MGATHSVQIQYNKAVAPPDSPGSSAIYRNADVSEELFSNLEDNSIQTCADFFLRSVANRGDCPFVGRRKHLGGDRYGEYEWTTYNEGLEIVKKIGAAIVKQDLMQPHHFPEHNRDIKILGIFAKNCVEWFYIEQVCNLYGFTLCPLYDTLGYASLRHILEQTRMSTLFVENINALIDLLNEHRFECLKNLIMLHKNSGVPEEAATELKAKGITIYYLQDLVDSYDGSYAEFAPDPSSVHTVCYTSGTGGMPKGCLIEQKNVVAVVSTALRFMIVPGGLCEFRPRDRFLSFLPLAHVYERCVCNIVIAYGDCIGVYSGDVKRLVEDIQQLRPSLLFAVPRVINRISDRIKQSVHKKPYAAQVLFNSGLEAKVRQKRQTGIVTHGFWDRAVFAKTKEILNPELRMIVSGGAPLHPSIAEQASCCFSIPIIQGYGLTESFGPCFLSSNRDPDASTVGSVFPCLEFKLVSIPELGNFVSSNPPSGEICLRGPGVVQEYLCHMKVDELWDELGWYHTGDIGVLLPNKGVRIVGRKRQVFKLSQGEYISPEKIENVYSQSIYIEQIFIAGNSFKTHPVALIVPDLEAALSWAAKNSLDITTLEEFCKLSSFRETILEDINFLASTNNLNGFEKPLECRLIPEPFSPQNLRMTPTLKFVRQQIIQDYSELLEEMYGSLP